MVEGHSERWTKTAGAHSPSAHQELRSRGPNGELLPAFAPALAEGQALYRAMLVLRIVSARMVALQREGAIGFHASSIGAEAVVAGATLACTQDDWIFPGTREWGAAVLREGSATRYVEQAFGHAGCPAKGHAAPDHLPARDVRVATASGLLGAHLPQAVGAAWAAKIRKDSVAALALFGASVAETGDFHSAVNFAGVLRAPCVLVGYGPDVGAVDQASGYGVASARVDGTDALAVWTVAREARGRASAGGGTTLIEARVGDLTEAADAALRREGWGGAAMRALGPNDPLLVLQACLEREGRFDARANLAIAEDVCAAIEGAVARAKSAPTPPATTLFDDVYATLPVHLAAQRAGLAAHARGVTVHHEKESSS